MSGKVREFDHDWRVPPCFLHSVLLAVEMWRPAVGNGVLLCFPPIVEVEH